MNISEPKAIIAAIVCLLLWISFLISPSVAKIGPSLLMWIVCSLNRDMLNAIRKLTKVIFFAAILFSVVASARVFGGTPTSSAIEHSLRAFGLLSTLVITVVILTTSVKTLDWLNFFELIHLSRGLIYVLLAAGTSLSLVSDHGRKAVSLLRLKGYRMTSLPLKMGAYVRIVAPTFSVLLQDITIQAISLHYRGFLERPLYRMEFAEEPKGKQLIWIISSFFMLLIGISLKLWM